MSWNRTLYRLQKTLCFLVSGVLLILVLNSVNWGEFALGKLHLVFIAVAVLVSVGGNIFLASYKLWLLLKWTDLSVPFTRVLRLILGLLAATFFTPFQSGHVLYAVALGRVERKPALSAFEVIALDKLMTLSGTTFLLFVGSLFLPDGHLLGSWVFRLLGIMGSILPFVLLFLPLLGKKWQFLRSLRVASNPLGAWKTLVLLALSTIYQMTDVLAVFLASQAVGVKVEFVQSLAVVPAIVLLALIPITISGLGAREPLLAILLPSSEDWNLAIQTGLIWDFTEYVVPALVGFVALPSLVLSLAKPEKEDQAKT